MFRNNMKKFFSSALFVLLCTVAFSLASCNKATYLRADVETIEAESDGETNELVLHSDGTDFQLVSSPEWVMTMLTDSILKYVVEENTGNANREGEIVVSCGEQKLVLKVVQGLPATKLSVNPTSLAIPKEGGTLTVNVDTDASNPKVTAPEGFTATYADGKLTVEATPEAKKEGTITLKTGKLKATITLSEKPDVCSRCGGSGRVTCTECKGEGITFFEHDGCALGMCCDRCDGIEPGSEGLGPRGSSIGSGKMKCPTCGGRGK